jgi:hypothetical protein
MISWRRVGMSLRHWGRSLAKLVAGLWAPWFPARTDKRPPLSPPIVVFRLHRGDGAAPPLQWKKCHPSTIRRFKAELTCPFGHTLTLRAHIVTTDGRVRPSVVCHSPGCEFHEFVQLKDWDGGHVP